MNKYALVSEPLTYRRKRGACACMVMGSRKQAFEMKFHGCRERFIRHVIMQESLVLAARVSACDLGG